MHQHPGLFPDLTVLENLFIGHSTAERGFINVRNRREQADHLLSLVGLRCSLSTPLSSLRISEQQLVEVARALSLDAKVLIMDEPTAALSQREVERLFEVVGDLRNRGTAMMFVGHRMDEIYRVADRITVLRDGRVIGTERVEDLPRDRAVQLMVGRAITSLYPSRHVEPGETLLQLKGLTRGEAFTNISFELRAGEIVGLGGLVGSGRTEVARVLFGIDQPTAGQILLGHTPTTHKSPRDAMRNGLAYVSEDRIGQSLVMDFSIVENASLTILDRIKRAGLVSRQKALDLVGPLLDTMRLRFDNYDQPVSTLSGGNQQKVVLAKWLATNPRILILDEPTQGVDVNTKADVHAMISDLAARGLGIILISSELPELIGMCDRIIVLREGHLAAQFTRGDADPENIIRAATGTVPRTDIARHDNVVALPNSGAAGTPDVAADKNEGGLKSWLLRRELGLIAAIAAVVVPVSFVNPRILSPANLDAIAMDAALLTLLAVAQMLVMLTRNIDLSVAAVVGLSAYGAASLLHTYPELGVGGGILIASLVGLTCGVVNGSIVAIGRVPSIVVTLGTMSVFRGVNSLWAGGKQISADQVPQAWLDFTSGRLLGIPAIFLFALVILALAGWALARTNIGREFFAIGSNPDGARLIGIPLRRREFSAFAIAGLIAGFTGALWASRYATIDARVAYGFELTVIAAVVVGGVALRGGAGSILGVALGSLTLLVIRNGLTLVRVDPLWLQGVYGLVILIAVVIDAYVRSQGRAGGAR
jgi:ABC-type sugar transport system ATPase subunit/ribose/xylose/arabinose/galactoside ABC-type transport system permease subunit